ncbi:MAG: glycine--tRNA ligase [SAR202 cluster bacterium]|nr:glycine--tRNA ligase [SAR202 cluster bacterium]
MTSPKHQIDLEELASLAKRRGFVFQSSEIYGGLASTWDYGPLGIELKRKLKELWWDNFVIKQENVFGLDSSIIMHPKVWDASGHTSNFSDPLVECKQCNHRYRSDQIESSECTNCGRELSEPRLFNLMFKTFLGPVEDNSNSTYLRPETAQGIFVNFLNVKNTINKNPPFGIAQIGKSFRNEITTGNFIFRTREFEMMEMEFFVPPEDDDQWHDYWINNSFEWYLNLGLSEKRLRIRKHEPEELAHYSKGTSDIEYLFPWGWGEIAGIANRTNYDLTAHSKESGKELSYFDETTKKHVIPYVVEPSFGLDRAVMALLIEGYTHETLVGAKGKEETRISLRLNPSVAPVQVAILPLSKKEILSELAREIYKNIKSSSLVKPLIYYDETQSIGRRYRRQDEIGTPLCVTVDFESLEDNAVTIRQRDSMDQKRVLINKLEDEIVSLLSNKVHG